MRKNISRILLAVLALALVIYVAIHLFATRTKFHDTYVNGNTAGNLYNGGLFCEYDGILYFANPQDGFRLYSMPVEGGTAKKICNDRVTYLNVDEHYIYYARDNQNQGGLFSFLHWNNNSLCRIDRNGKHFVVLDSDPSMYASLLGDYLYYIHYDTENASQLYRVRIDGKEREKVDDSPYYTCSTNGSVLYYNGLKRDRHIYSLDTRTGSETTLFLGDCWMPVVEGDVAYYLDVSNDYRLTRADLNTQETRALTQERVDCFNVAGGYIYYARNEDPALCRMKIDGSDQEEIMSGIFTDIHVTSRYAYFCPLNEEGTFYCVPTVGAQNVTMFEPFVED